MKHTFEIKYELDTPLAIAVAIYLDCEHYVYLHRGLSNKIEIIGKGDDYYMCHQSWSVFGIKIGQTYTCKYLAPATFINTDVKPFPSWIPSIHHLVHIQTALRYYQQPEKNTTLSELMVEMDMPFWLYPFRNAFRRTIAKIKILKDLEDVALIDRRARLFGRESNEAYLKKHQFMLHKEEYVKYFAANSIFLGDSGEHSRKEEWPNIKDLDFPYVRRFLKKDYIRYSNFSNSEFQAERTDAFQQQQKSNPEFPPHRPQLAAPAGSDAPPSVASCRPAKG